MSAAWLHVAILFAHTLSPPRQAAVIRLHHVPAAEVERLLAPEDGSSLVPPGVLAWTVDERRNALSVSGSDEAIAAFRQLVRLIDVTPARVRLSVRILSPETVAEGRLDATAPPGGVTGGQNRGLWAVLKREQIAALETGPAEGATEMEVTHRHSLGVRWPEPEGVPVELGAVTPRINRDRTVTLSFAKSAPSPQVGSAGQPELVMMRRLSVGEGVVVLPRRPGHDSKGAKSAFADSDFLSTSGFASTYFVRHRVAVVSTVQGRRR
jgi:hypothetical protein